MGSQLPLFDAQDYSFLPSIGEVPPSMPSVQSAGLVGFEQPPLRTILPARYLEGLDTARRALLPFDRALVIYGTGGDVKCEEMRWGMTGVDGAPALTVMRRGLWPGLRKARGERRCIVAAASFILAPGDGKGIAVAAIMPNGHDPFYLAGLCRMTPDGPAFSLIQRPARGSLKRAGGTMPMLVREDDVWNWLNTGFWSLRPDFGRAHPDHMISFVPLPES